MHLAKAEFLVIQSAQEFPTHQLPVRKKQTTTVLLNSYGMCPFQISTPISTGALKGTNTVCQFVLFIRNLSVQCNIVLLKLLRL